MSKPELKTFTRDEVAKHATPDNLWVIIDTLVYDLTKFIAMHPGGEHVLVAKDVAGKDVTDIFYGLHRHEVLSKYKRLVIGTIKDEKPKVFVQQPGEVSLVPHAEPAWLTKGYFSPYYDSSHRKLQRELRLFVDEYLKPDGRDKEESGKRPDVDLIKKMGANYIQHMRLGPGKHLHGLTLPGGLKGEDFTYFHELVINQELARIGYRGYGDGLQGGMVIGLPPVMNFGSEELKRKVVPDVLAGNKFISLAITEAFAGSDVAGMRTTAEKTPDGKHYIVNGTKKWITNGTFSDYFSTGVVTGKGQLSMLLIERDDNVETKAIKTSYSPAAGTSYITFDNVKVPVENLLGEEGKGIQVILSNFNHERWVMCCSVSRSIRSVTEECFKWACLRKAFGKPLISQPVIRQKIAHMFAKVESIQAWLEHITFQMTNMSYKEQSEYLAGQIGLLKAYSTKMAGEISDDAVQVFGGRGITKTGMGSHIEGFRRTQKFDAVLGGAEEVLFDLGVRRAQMKMPKIAPL